MEIINQLARYIFSSMSSLWEEISIWAKINEDGLGLILLVILVLWIIFVFSSLTIFNKK